MTDSRLDFHGRIIRRHADGRRVYIEFDNILKVGPKDFAFGLYDLAKSPGDEQKRLATGTKVTGRVWVNGHNVAIVEELKKTE